LPRDFREALAGSIWIHGNVTRTGLHDSKYAGNCGRRLVKINPDAIAGNDANLDKRMCQLIAEPFQLPISERMIKKAHRLSIWAQLRAFSQ
jgi:hypothetical protein